MKGRSALVVSSRFSSEFSGGEDYHLLQTLGSSQTRWASADDEDVDIARRINESENATRSIGMAEQDLGNVVRVLQRVWKGFSHVSHFVSFECKNKADDRRRGRCRLYKTGQPKAFEKSDAAYFIEDKAPTGTDQYRCRTTTEEAQRKCQGLRPGLLLIFWGPKSCP
jgi:hypothetical protein